MIDLTALRQHSGASRPALALALFLAGTAAGSAQAQEQTAFLGTGDILVIAQRQARGIENAPSTRASIDADTIATTVNAVNVEDTLKYLPSLIVRKRHIGDTQAPLATRTSGLGSSSRSLIYADGALLSALIGNNNTSASPRWSLVSPQEIARIDVLYGPFSAAYAGNSIGAVVNITTRLPDTLEGTISAGVNVQTYDQYGTHETLPSYQMGATLGDRFGPLALFASVDHVASRSQPLLYTSIARPDTPSTLTGGYDAVNRTNAPIRIIGAGGLEHQVQDHIKFKAALDITPDIRLTYVGGLFRNDTDAHTQSYLLGGGPISANGLYRYDQRHWSHALSATGSTSRFDWQIIGTLYDFAHDVQRTPTTLLPGAMQGGPGTITRLEGTGWKTLDARGAWKPGGGAHVLSFGAHIDRFEIDSNRYTTSDWISGSEGTLNLRSKGKTRTAALWAQDAWKIVPDLTLTLGGRYEWWKAFGGVNFSLSPLLDVRQPTLSARRFSPKAALAWTPRPDWTVRLSFGKAYRFPTVGELYQIVTSPVPAVPDPTLKPERALSEELAIERHDAQGWVRLSFFNEAIRNALVSQSGPLPDGSGTIATFVQNVDRTRARGVELAFERSDIVPRLDISGSVTYADARTMRDRAFPAAEGKLLPQVPHWKASLVATWRPTDQIALTAAGRYASRLYGTINNSDSVGNTYQGFYKYLVVDLRAEFKVSDHWTLGLGVDNVNNDKYFLFHPFPQRSFAADMTFRF